MKLTTILGFFILMKSYSEKLKDPRWQQKRLLVFERDKWKCQECGNMKSTLHVHHLKYTSEPWDAPIDDLKTVCESCHAIEHTTEKNEVWFHQLPRNRKTPILFNVYTDEFKSNAAPFIQTLWGQMESILSNQKKRGDALKEYYDRLVFNNAKNLDEKCIIYNYILIVSDDLKYGDGSHGGLKSIIFTDF